MKLKLRAMRIRLPEWHIATTANFVGCCLPTTLATMADASAETCSLYVTKARFNTNFIQ